MMENKLRFPESINVQIIDKDTNKPVSKIVLLLTIYAQAKNDYHLGPMPSGLDGKIVIDRNWVRSAIDYQRNTFLMDYQTSMNDCWSNVKLKVMSLDEINRAISAMELYDIENGDPTIARTVLDMKNSVNINYKPLDVYVQLENPNEQLRTVEIKIERL